jgi:hypothetical protein
MEQHNKYKNVSFFIFPIVEQTENLELLFVQRKTNDLNRSGHCYL